MNLIAFEANEHGVPIALSSSIPLGGIAIVLTESGDLTYFSSLFRDIKKAVENDTNFRLQSQDDSWAISVGRELTSVTKRAGIDEVRYIHGINPRALDVDEYGNFILSSTKVETGEFISWLDGWLHFLEARSIR